MNSLHYCLKYPQNKFLLAINIICLIIFSYSITNWYFINDKNKALQNQVIEITTNISQKMKLSGINDAYINAVDKLAMIEKISNQQISQSILMLTLDDLAQKNEVNIISQDFEKQQIDNNKTNLLLYLNIEAKYPSIHRLLEQFGKTSVLFAIEEATISRSQISTNQVQAALRITLYNTEISEKEDIQ